MGKVKKTKQKDFIKKKLKVGKSKQPANNATNLSFQSKQIRITERVLFDSATVFENQNITKQYLSEKLAQLNNNSDSVRLDAIGSIKIIFENSTDLIISNMGPVCAGIAKASIDLDDGVGRAILSLASNLFEIVNQEQITPFFNLFIVYTASGISHINERVRFRSLKFAKLFLDKYPDLVAKSSARLIPNFLQLILGRESSFTNSKLGMFKSRDEVLLAFEELLALHFNLTFIAKRLEQKRYSIHNWKSAHSHTLEDYSLLQSTSESAFNLNFNDEFAANGSKLDMTKKSDKKMMLGAMRNVSFDGLFARLVSFWIESYEFLIQESELKNSAHLRICCSVINLMNMIWPKMSQNEHDESLQILQHVTPKFPFGKRMSYRDEEVTVLLVGMNMNYCTMGFHLASHAGPENGAAIIQSIADYITKLLKSSRGSKDITSLPFKQLFLSIDSEPLRQELMNTLLQYQECLEDSEFSYKAFSLIKGLTQIDCPYAQNWILGLPKQLWKLKNKNEAFSVDICSFFKKIIIEAKPGDNDLVHKIQMALIPIFTRTNQLHALFTRITVPLQMAILEILYYIPFWNDILTEKLLYCCFECSHLVNLRVFDIAKSSSLKCSLLIGSSLEQLQISSTNAPPDSMKVIDLDESETRMNNYQAMHHMACTLPSSCADAVFDFWHASSSLRLSLLSFSSFLDIMGNRRSGSGDSITPLVAESIIDALTLVLKDDDSSSSLQVRNIVTQSIIRYLKNPTPRLGPFIQYCLQRGGGQPQSKRVQEAVEFLQHN